MIAFNKPYISGDEQTYMLQALASGKLSGDGVFTMKCQQFFETTYGFKKTLLTTSCTDALELAALLIDVRPGDEIIIPSYTFVSSANPFILRGAKIVFADSQFQHPNIDANSIEKLITPKTKAILVVHYAGVACNMDELSGLSKKHGLVLIEDAAQAVHAFYKNKPLGSFGHLSAFSFHDTKNITCGEGGMLVINDEQYIRRAEIIREKGTNRSAFLRGEINKYEWVDIGSSFLPSDLTAAFLYAQIQNIEAVTQKRLQLWNSYYNTLKPLHLAGKIHLPHVSECAVHNASIFYVQCKGIEERLQLSAYLKENGVQTAFHYVPLHTSKFYSSAATSVQRELPNAAMFSDCLLRLPLYYDLSEGDVLTVSGKVLAFYNK